MDFIYSDLGYRSILRSDDTHILNNKTKVNEFTLINVQSIQEITKKTHSDSKKEGLVSLDTETIIKKKIVGKKGKR